MNLQDLRSTGSKDKPLWTQCVFIGEPPLGFKDWHDWVNRSTEAGVFAGVTIKASTKEDWMANVLLERRAKNEAKENT